MLKWSRVRNGSETLYKAKMDGATYYMINRDKKVTLEIWYKKYYKCFTFEKVKDAKAKAEAMMLNNKMYRIYGD